MEAIFRELEKQRQANKSSLKFFDDFAGHRKNQTEIVLAASEGARGRLCVLGAGNCFDLDLPAVTQVFQEVHLVDIDAQALRKARARLPGELRERVHLHAPLDISGANKAMDSWRTMAVSPAELMNFPDRAVGKLASALPGPFDCVVSSCLLSQILLTFRRVVGEGHQLFQAGVMTLLVTHLRLLAELTAPGRVALLVSDVSSNEIAPFGQFPSSSDGLGFLKSRILENQVFNFVSPDLILELAKQDPLLDQSTTMSPPHRAWLWCNGPQRTFLVYAATMKKKAVHS